MLSLSSCLCTVCGRFGAVFSGVTTGRSLIFSVHTALERLQPPKRGGSQLAINAREAVRFLDRVTSGKDSIPPERIVLQGPMEQYEDWAEAEAFFLPEYEEEAGEAPDVGDRTAPTPKAEEPKTNGHVKTSTNDGRGLPGLPSDLSQMLLSKLNFKAPPQDLAPGPKEVKSSVSIPSTGTRSDQASRSSSRSSRSSPEYVDVTVVNGDGPIRRPRTTSTGCVPAAPMEIRPLLSALLWRLHANKANASPVKNLMLVTNDRSIQEWAQKFGIMAKNIHQLRTAIQYEEREYKNRCKYAEKLQASTEQARPLFQYDNESDEDELVFVPRGGRGKGGSRGSSSRGGNGRKGAARVPSTSAPPIESVIEIPSEPIDPNSFSRSLGPTTTVKQPGVESGTQGGSRGGSTRRSGGGRRGGGPRGRGGNGGSRGRGKLWVP